MQPIARWGLVPAGLAPVLLIGGWTVAASRWREPFDPSVETISALAALDAPDRWVMTSALLGLGACHVGTAVALRPAGMPGRLLLGLGGLATAGVALAPLPADGGTSPLHTATAGVAFVALAVWPAAAWRRRPAGGSAHAGGPALRRGVCIAAAAGLTALVGWFVVELGSDGPRVGLTERVAAGAQALWPLAVVASGVRVRNGVPPRAGRVRGG